MLDQVYIDEIKQIENEKEAKSKLYDYAKSFDIRVYKKDTLDEMIAMLSKKLNELQNEPMPDEPVNGLTISDLIQADDELNGSVYLDESEAKPEAISALKGESPIELTIVKPSENRKIELKLHVPEPLETPQEKLVVEVKKSTYELPAKFSPTIALLGKNPGYCTLPWWIYQWILENPNWKENPEKCTHFHAISTLQSLIYYIKRDDNVMIRETRNSKFITLN